MTYGLNAINIDEILGSRYQDYLTNHFDSKSFQLLHRLHYGNYKDMKLSKHCDEVLFELNVNSNCTRLIINQSLTARIFQCN